MQRTFLVVLTSLSILVGVSAQSTAPAPQAPNASVQPAPFTPGPTWSRLRSSLDTILGWHVGVPLRAFGQGTVVEAIPKTAGVGVTTAVVSSVQSFGPDVRKPLDHRLSADEVQAVTAGMKGARVRVSAYITPEIASDESSARRQFEVVKALGAATLIVESIPSSLPRIEALANAFDVRVAIGGRPDAIAAALQGRGERLGAYIDMARWLEAGISPIDGVGAVRSRVFAIRVADRDASGRPALIGSGAARVTAIFEELRRANATLVVIVDGAGAADPSAGLLQALADFEEAIRPVAARRVAEIARGIPIRGPERLRPEERERVLAAIPSRPAATPKQRRRLLVFDANIGYGGNTGGHRSIPAATLLLDQFARNTGAFEVVFSNDLDNFKYDTLRQFDAVLLNNAVGLVFVDQELRDSLSRFIREGGGLAGYHGTSHTSMDWPEFREILGAFEGGHKQPTEVATVKIDDPTSPLTAAFQGRSFTHEDEFYRFPVPLPARDRVRALMSIDVANTDMNQPGNCGHCNRPDNDYVLSWIRTHGKGRVFYTALGHAPAFFMDEKINAFFLAGIQFVLGDLDADATPIASAAAR